MFMQLLSRWLQAYINPKWKWIFWVLVRLWTEVLRTQSSTQLGFELVTSRSWQYISCHWDACSNLSAISDYNWKYDCTVQYIVASLQPVINYNTYISKPLVTVLHLSFEPCHVIISGNNLSFCDTCILWYRLNKLLLSVIVLVKALLYGNGTKYHVCHCGKAVSRDYNDGRLKWADLKCANTKTREFFLCFPCVLNLW